jgi:hypothetical protein
VDTVFSPELEGLDREEICQWYNGYNWTGTSVYNPFDLLLLFDHREFRPYWFETGTPTFLIDLLTERKLFTPDLTQIIGSEALLSTFDVGDIATEALMFQSGYLTIKSVQRMGGQPRYHLGYPNLEVEASLNEALLRRYSPDAGVVIRQTTKLYDLLLVNDFNGLQVLFTALFASIPNDWYRNNPIAQYEGYYASVFYSHFAAIGLDIRVEDATNKGRIDMTVLFNNHIYIIEFKVVDDKATGEAMAQIKSKDYSAKYKSLAKPIHLIGVEFGKADKGVVGFEVESL